MTDPSVQNNQQTQLSVLAIRWFSSNKKSRKEFDWTPLYNQMTAFLMHDVEISQLLLSPTVLHENAQLLLNSLVCLQTQKDETFAEYLGIEMLILLQGTLLVDEKQSEVKGMTVLQALPISRSEKSLFRSKEKSIILKGQRKVFEKFRNDILKLDREQKEAFIAKHLFCGLTPVYPLAAVRLLQLIQATELKCDENSIVLLHNGLIHRKPKKNGEGTQLTSGSIINARYLSKLLQMSNIERQGQQLLQTLEESLIIKFHVDQLLRILKLNPSLKKILENKLRTIFQERKSLEAKSIEVDQNFTNRSKVDCSTIRKHYPIEFKNRPKTAQGRSFRRKRDNQNSDQYIGDFITFDRYEKMLASKEKVVVAKSLFKLEARGRSIVSFDYDKKLKIQAKMLKIQTGKIQRLGQRQSVSENSHMKEIKKKLFQVTHLFDQPLDPSAIGTPSNKEIIQRKPSTARKMSGIKPEEYLKQEYLNAFLNHSSNEPKLKERINYEGKMIPQILVQNKQNILTVSRFSKKEGLLGMKKKSALKMIMNSTIN